MSKLSRLSLTVLVLALITAAPTLAKQQPTMPGDSTVPSVDNSKFRATGSIIANNVYVRSGPSDNDYPVMKLDKGASIVAVGLRHDWLKIVPPDGSFCYVAKAYVDRHGDGSRGKVTSTLNVRVGSALNTLKTKLATKLEPGADVTILGDQDEYYKIKPPEDVFLYVNKQFVEATKVIAQNDSNVEKPPVLAERETPPVNQQPTEPKTEVANNDSSGGSFGLDSATSNPPVTPNESATAIATPTTNPSTQPAMADAGSEFDRLETIFAEMKNKPLDQQDIPTLQASYEKLAMNGSALPESLRRVAEEKAKFLSAREKDRQEFMAVKKRQDEMAQRQTALRSEREEIEQRIQKTEVRYFTAVGVLRPSSLQQGSQMLYRLTDPANGRTVVYLRTDDNKIGTMLGQFIGVKGDVSNDTQLSLRVIAPTAFEPVDPNKLYTNVASQIIPPSLMPGGSGTATTDGE